MIAMIMIMIMREREKKEEKTKSLKHSFSVELWWNKIMKQSWPSLALNQSKG